LAVWARPAALLYAVVKSLWACSAGASAECFTPPNTPGGKPLIAVPGLTPTLASNVLGPVFVTLWPARTEYADAVPSSTGAGPAAPAGAGSASTMARATPPPSAALELKAIRWLRRPFPVRRSAYLLGAWTLSALMDLITLSISYFT
jgi:hypothetical protein